MYSGPLITVSTAQSIFRFPSFRENVVKWNRERGDSVSFFIYLSWAFLKWNNSGEWYLMTMRTCQMLVCCQWIFIGADHTKWICRKNIYTYYVAWKMYKYLLKLPEKRQALSTLPFWNFMWLFVIYFSCFRLKLYKVYKLMKLLHININILIFSFHLICSEIWKY